MAAEEQLINGASKEQKQLVKNIDPRVEISRILVGMIVPSPCNLLNFFRRTLSLRIKVNLLRHHILRSFVNKASCIRSLFTYKSCNYGIRSETTKVVCFKTRYY
jgi:hypothetical protein